MSEEKNEFSNNLVSKIGYREASKEPTKESLEAKEKYDKIVEELGLTDKTVQHDENEKNEIEDSERE